VCLTETCITNKDSKGTRARWQIRNIHHFDSMMKRNWITQERLYFWKEKESKSIGNHERSVRTAEICRGTSATEKNSNQFQVLFSPRLPQALKPVWDLVITWLLQCERLALVKKDILFITLPCTAMREGLLFETEILWGLKTRSSHGLESLGTLCYSIWVEDNQERWLRDGMTWYHTEV
jgi:hypothetical protein